MDQTEALYLKFFGFVLAVAAVVVVLGVGSCTDREARMRSDCIEACGPGHVAQLPNGTDRCVCGVQP